MSPQFELPPKPPASSSGVAVRMAKVQRQGTKPELALRQELFRRGLRYRVGYPVPFIRRRTIDVAFPGKRLAVFVDGCFWHDCPDHRVKVKANSDWWEAKLDSNRRRDLETGQLLENAGWSVLRIWEHVPAAEGADMVVAALRHLG